MLPDEEHEHEDGAKTARATMTTVVTRKSR